jgi:hypothetical protein
MREIAIMVDIRNVFSSNIRGGLIGLLSAGIILIILYFVTFMVAFGNPGPFADAYLSFAGFLLSGVMPLVILAAGYLAGTFGIRK